MTLGCKVNHYETEAMAELFEQAGWEVAPFPAQADVYVVNTCTVTAVSDATLTVEISDKVRVKLARNSVSGLLQSTSPSQPPAKKKPDEKEPKTETPEQS